MMDGGLASRCLADLKVRPTQTSFLRLGNVAQEASDSQDLQKDRDNQKGENREEAFSFRFFGLIS
jgi:hypothetical protein